MESTVSIVDDILQSHNMVLDHNSGIIQKRELLRIMETKTCHEREIIWDELIRRCEVGKLRTALHLDYIFRTVGERHVWDRRKIAVIAHINYTDLISRCFRYIARIPAYIDIYITTKGDKNIGLIQKKIAELPEHHITIVVPEDRGREISGLLVACKDILMKYEYLCFVHDKRSNKGEGYQTVGQSFCDILWENSIKNQIYIENVIKAFEEEPRLGLLAPPAPYVSKLFMVGFLGWCDSYNQTEKLSERLHLQCRLNRSEPPFVLGTTFWCRTKALRPLFEAGLTYEDFEPEPMPTDNTISHAIERILPYAAQSEGYYSGIMMTAEYASLYACNYRYMMDTIVDKVVLDDRFSGQPILYSDIEDRGLRIKPFIDRFSRIYIYGAGMYGRQCLDTIKEYDFQKIGAFLVSDGRKTERGIEGVPIMELGQICPREDEGIIVALNYLDMLNVFSELRKRNFQNIERYL